MSAEPQLTTQETVALPADQPSTIRPQSPAWPRRLTTSFLVTAALIACFLLPPLASNAAHVPVVVVCVLTAWIVGIFTRLTFELTSGFGGRVRRGAAALGSALLGCALIAAASSLEGWPSQMTWLEAAVGLSACTLYLASAARALEIRRGAANRRVFLIGSAQTASDVAREVACRGDLRMVGHLVSERLINTPTATDLIVQAVQQARPTVLVMSAEAARDKRMVAAASSLHERGLRVRTLGEYYEEVFAKVPLGELTEEWFLFDIAEIHRPRLYGALKRAGEIAISAALVLVTLPLAIVLALAVRLSSPGPVLFRQQRMGKGGKPIELTKFRTMRVSETQTDSWAGAEPHRITRVGRYLRRYRLDELPQLLNVLRGDLSLVGPRPEQPSIAKRLGESIPFYMTRYKVRPGLTGWAQVNHGYGGSDAGTLEKLQYDFFYLKRQGFRLDMWIMFATLRTVLAGRGE